MRRINGDWAGTALKGQACFDYPNINGNRFFILPYVGEATGKTFPITFSTRNRSDACTVNSVKMRLFAILKIMKRDQMLMEAILGKLLEAPEPHINVDGVAQRLHTDQSVIRHLLRLLHDKGWVAEAETGFWRLTNAGHDYLEGPPEQGISLKSLGLELTGPG